MPLDITGVDIYQFMREVYAMSFPAGLGIHHYREGELDHDTIQSIVNEKCQGNALFVMDYVHGRCCGMVVWKDENGLLYIRDTWHRHTAEELDELLRRCGMTRKEYVPKPRPESLLSTAREYMEQVFWRSKR